MFFINLHMSQVHAPNVSIKVLFVESLVYKKNYSTGSFVLATGEVDEIRAILQY
jgi:hypothetical protein